MYLLAGRCIGQNPQTVAGPDTEFADAARYGRSAAQGFEQQGIPVRNAVGLTHLGCRVASGAVAGFQLQDKIQVL